MIFGAFKLGLDTLRKDLYTFCMGDKFMKKYIISLLMFLLCVSFGVSKHDFSKPGTVKNFEPRSVEDVSYAAVVSKGNGKKKTPAHLVPVNVLPISIEKYVVENGEEKRGINICSAMRLTSTLVLTAAHCLEDFSHEQMVYAEPFVAQDNRMGLTLAAVKKGEEYVKPNAKIVFYRPGYASDGSAMSHAFDFALIKLDNRLKFNTSHVKQEMEKALENIPEGLRAQIDGYTQTAQMAVKKEADKQQTLYAQFIKTPLEKFDLLQMEPDVVKEEMQNRVVRAYFWPGYENTPERGPVEVFSGSVLGTDEKHHGNTHTLLWNIHTKPGSSGSPVLDLQRKLIVSVTSGPIHGDNVHGGGLISQEVCQWVKSHDASVKCLAVYGGKSYQETDKTSDWGK